MTFDNRICNIYKESNRSENVLEDEFAYIPLLLLSKSLGTHGQRSIDYNPSGAAIAAAMLA